MKVIRFIAEDDQIYYGHQYEKEEATRLEGVLFETFKDTGQRMKVKKLLAPVVPVAILCIGLNYRHHAQETRMPLPDYPIVFMKNPAALLDPFDPIRIPKVCMDPPEVDFEVELVAVIGKPAKNVSAEDALAYVAGYTIGNDVSARRWQKMGGNGQWVRGKSFDTFCPLGPFLVTKEEIPDPHCLDLSLTLNGKQMQSSNTSDLIFTVNDLIAFLSQGTTLLPGTVIMTGTPSGVGFVRNPPVFLQPEDRLSLRIEKIGTLSNPVANEV